MKKFLILIFLLLLAAGCLAENAPRRAVALYRGVDNYGSPGVNKARIASFRYRFVIDGRETLLAVDPGPKTGGAYSYPIQNRLKVGYVYLLELQGDMVTGARELTEPPRQEFRPAACGVPGLRTLGNFLRTAAAPVGTVLYVYGGGWDWQDEGSSLQAGTIGVSRDWVAFFDRQGPDYTYKDPDKRKSYYPFGGFNQYYYAGLDCSGYVGWALYNTFEKESGGPGWVGSAAGFAKRLSDKGLGRLTRDARNSRPGDIVSISGHVWISLGTCPDGSAVIFHSSPAKSRTGHPGGGVEISAVGPSRSCRAFRLADKYMKERYPRWYERYPVMLCSPQKYFEIKGDATGRFTWDTVGAPEGLSDPDGVADMSPEEVLEFIYSR